VTYVGDGVWDLRASRSLGYRFIGVGFYDTGRALRDEGAACVFSDFTDRAAFLAVLAEVWADRRRP
jgi:phosphoglycolate phosphatase-like HAD superfamily hydrolase